MAKQIEEGERMIDTDKYEGHTPANEWLLVFKEVNKHNNKQMLGLTVRAYHLGQMQACDYEDYLVAQANQDLARDAPKLLAEVKRLREQYTELREALVGDSPNWTHEELIEQALELSKPVELEFGEWHTDEGDD